MDITKKPVDSKERPLVLMRLQQRAQSRKRYVAQIPRWRHPLVGYLLIAPLVGLGLLVPYLERSIVLANNFLGATLLLAVLVLALLWGAGPALCGFVLGLIALDYFYVPPLGYFNLMTWEGFLQLLPYTICGLVIAVITAQRENARQKALVAEQEAHLQTFELAQVNQELEQADQLKDQFLSMASHELKTPLTTIRGQAQITLRRLARQKELSPDLTSARAALEKIDEQTGRLNTLVNDLLDLSSIRAGKIPLRLRPCDLREVCREGIEEQRLLTDRPIELVVPADPVLLQADSDRLNQVLVNLVGNALKYSPEDSPVQVRVEVRQQSQDEEGQKQVAIIAIHDSGPGIPKEQQEHIFEPFYRAPNAEKSRKDGWGLGLAICKDIIERHGGRIWCESQKGQGSTFSVELPV